MSEQAPKKILIVPLDWGLGHTTRCIPIIRVLIALQCEVHIGGTEITNGLLKKEFPDLVYHSFPSYNISYPEKGSEFLKHIMWQMPRVAATIKQERLKTRELFIEYAYDIIISDNRFGVHNKACKNIFITHQLNVAVPQSKVLEHLTNLMNHRYINQFDQVAVPDWEGNILSGALANAKGIRVPITYLGNLSRWVEGQDNFVKGKSILAILSGPEPQRSMLENLLVEQFKNIEGEMTIVRAKPNELEVPLHEKVKFINHLPSNALQKLAKESDIIISRAGYSTIMDLVVIQKHAILIPTPGQTEQEYLAKRLQNERLFLFYNQAEFEMQKAFHDYAQMLWHNFPKGANNLQEIIKELIAI